MHKRLYHLIAYFFLYVTTSAQQMQVENYTPANGLLDTRVIRIFQDNRGILYFLTWEGISVFDGQRFENITEYNGTPLGLVNDMVQWKNDTCYVFTFHAGIFKLINNRLIKDPAFNIIAEPNHVIKIKENDWIITSNKGLYRWINGECRPVITNRGGKPEAPVDFAALAKNYIIYSETTDRKLRLLQLSGLVVKDSINQKIITGIQQDKYGTIYVCAEGKWMTLNKEALNLGKLQLIPTLFDQKLPAGFNIDNLFVSENKIWLEDYKNGYILFSTEKTEPETLGHQAGLNPGASSIFADKENNYWFVIFSKQVQKAYTTRLKHIYENKSGGAIGLLPDENNNAFMQSGNQLFPLMQTTHLPAVKTAVAGSNPFYWQGQLWYFKTASTIQNNNGEVIRLHLPDAAENNFLNNNRITFDKAGRLIISGNQLFVIETNLTVHAAQLPYFTDNIAVDDDNNYWAFNRGGEIQAYSIKDNKLIRYKDIFRIDNIGPRYALHWNADTFCLGTRQHGIIWLSVKNGRLSELARLNTSKGLSNNFASCLVRKGSSLLYAATEFGLDEIKINGTDTSVQNLGAANNLFLPFSYVVKNKEGEIFARSNDNQVWKVAESVTSTSGFIPSAWFSGITVNGKTTDLSVNAYSFNENNFRFTVSAPSLLNAGKIRYNFLLENERRQWQQLSAENFYSINNLSPGKYKLRVTVSYPGKIYPDKTITYTFVIRPPVWKRWWFISLVGLATGLLFWAIIRAYYQRKLAIQKAEAEKRKAVEKERNRISRDMHDDMGSGLTKIAILSEVAKKQLSEPDKARKQLETISESSRELVDSLQDIIWVLNPKNDTLESLSAYIREYALKYFEPFSVKVEFVYPEQFSIQHLSEEKRRNVYLTVKESLNNIAKHAWCNTVTIGIKEFTGKFEITIHDDGKGFEPDKVRLFANGLKNMENRIGQVGGSFEVKSAPGQGTATRISMPV